MALQRLIFANAALFALAACRIAGYVVVSPFPGQNVSRTQRATLVVTLAWLATSFSSSHGVPREFNVELAASAVLELACGIMVGVAFRFVFAAAEVLGTVLGQMTGLGSPSVLNPTMDAPETPIARVVGLCAMLVALAAGVHRVALAGLLESFRTIPVGTAAVLQTPILRYVDLGIDAFVTGVRLSTPVVAVGLLAQLALALVSRAAPSVQIFSVGFAVLFVSGIVSILACLDELVTGLATHFASLGPFLDEALGALQR
jgi:flagellar biosynthesis protein FliR